MVSPLQHIIKTAVLGLTLFGPWQASPAAATDSGQSLTEIRYGNWRSARIGGGGYAMNLKPTSDPKIYYLYTDVGGFYRSDDAGKTWKMKQGGLPARTANQEVRGLLVDPRNPDHILVATGSHWKAEREGVYRSTDGGNTFTKTLNAAFAGNGNERMWGEVLAVDPKQPDVVLAASMEDGVFRSEDFGQNWEKVGLMGLNPTDLDFDHAVPGRVLLVARPYRFFHLAENPVYLRGGLFESLDGGKTWEQLLDSKDAPFEVVQAPSSFNSTWVGVFPQSVMKHSTDGGKTWKDYAQGLPQNTEVNFLDENLVITPWGSVAPFVFTALAAGPDFLLAGAGDGKVYRRGSKDDAWQEIKGKASAPESWYGNAGQMPGWVHFGKAISSLVVDPHNANRWWLTDWYMIWDSKNAGKNWEFAGNGYELTVIHNLAQVPDDPGLVHLGMCDNGYFRSKNGGASYRQNWNVITNNIKDIAVSPVDNARLYAIGPTESGHWYSSHVFVSSDSGSTWQAAKMDGTRDAKSRRINSVVADPKEQDTVYVTVAGTPGEQGGVFKSTDAGETWSEFNQGMPKFDIFRADIWIVGRELALSTDGSMVAISANHSRVMAYDPKTAAWSEINAKLLKPNSVIADPFQPGRFALASMEKGVFISEDGGRTWKATGVETPAQHVTFDQKVKGRIAVGTTNGIKLSKDGGDTWEAVDKALPNRVGNPVAFAGDRLIAGTSGSGAFWLPLTEAAAETIQADSVQPAVEEQAVEIVQNGDFSEADDQIPNGWKVRWSDVEAHRVEQDPETLKSEPASLVMELPQEGYCVIEQELLPDSLGKWVKFSGSSRGIGDFSEALVAVQLMSATDEQVAWINVAEIKPTEDWVAFKQTIELPDNYAKAYLLLHFKGLGEIQVDDLSGKVVKK